MGKIVRFFCVCIMALFCAQVCAQTNPIPMGNIPDDAGFAQLKAEFGQHKKIPPEFEKEILTALSFFPELKKNRIDFVMRKGYAPLSSRPTYGGLFRSALYRKYKIFISTGSGKRWDSIILAHSPYNPRVGVLGHELSHVLNFSRMSGLSLTWLGVMHVSRKYMDRFEYRTDSLCIAKGMGEYLYAMSVHVRTSFGMEDPEEGNVIAQKSNYKERYMSPASIRLYMQEHPPYRFASGSSK
jgi:hypothetical protein